MSLHSIEASSETNSPNHQRNQWWGSHIPAKIPPSITLTSHILLLKVYSTLPLNLFHVIYADFILLNVRVLN
jgi:hypothetical protein